jgi:hypothetical protein
MKQNNPEDGPVIVPFGKYKGSDITELLKDRSYVEWARLQAWLPQRYPVIYNVIVGGSPAKGKGKKQDSPEHNAMQTRFLNTDLCERLGRRYVSGEARLRGYIRGDDAIGGLTYRLSVDRLKFEHRLWDVVFDIRAALEDATGSHVGAVSMAHLYVELKPSISDDFFAVLRQVTNRRDQQNARDGHGDLDRILVVTDAVAPSNVSVDEVKAAFRTQKVDLVLSSDLEVGEIAA